MNVWGFQSIRNRDQGTIYPLPFVDSWKCMHVYQSTANSGEGKRWMSSADWLTASRFMHSVTNNISSLDALRLSRICLLRVSIPWPHVYISLEIAHLSFFLRPCWPCSPQASTPVFLEDTPRRLFFDGWYKPTSARSSTKFKPFIYTS